MLGILLRAKLEAKGVDVSNLSDEELEYHFDSMMSAFSHICKTMSEVAESVVALGNHCNALTQPKVKHDGRKRTAETPRVNGHRDGSRH